MLRQQLIKAQESLYSECTLFSYITDGNIFSGSLNLLTLYQQMPETVYKANFFDSAYRQTDVCARSAKHSGVTVARYVAVISRCTKTSTVYKL